MSHQVTPRRPSTQPSTSSSRAFQGDPRRSKKAASPEKLIDSEISEEEDGNITAEIDLITVDDLMGGISDDE